MSTDNATKTDLLSLQDRLNKLDAMADDPWKYKAVEWDEAYADAQYEARACKGMAMGAQAHDIAERFKRAGKRFHACAALDLVPAEKAVSFSMDVRVTEPAPIGPGDPQPPPPTKAGEWTGALVFERIAPKGLTNPVGYRAATEEEQAELDRMARAINRNSSSAPKLSGEALYVAMQSVDGGKLNRAMSCAWVMLSDGTRDYYNAVAAKLSP